MDLDIDIQKDVDVKIKKDLKEHLVQTTKTIHGEWTSVNIPELSRKELLEIAKIHGLENDIQTGNFCRFLNLSTNFASMDFRSRFFALPNLVNSVQDLLNKMQEEIKEFAEIAVLFSHLIRSFVKIVINTKHNLNLANPLLEQSVMHIEVIKDALSPNSPDLNKDDQNDLDFALESMSLGIIKLLDHAKTSKKESIELDKKVNDLKENIETKITINQNRISFGQIMPTMGASLGMVTGAGVAGSVVQSVAFGGAGALVLGGLSFPPLGAILLGGAIGAFSIGSILLFIVKLWKKHQHKALGYLKKILEKLNELNSANLAFMNYMNKSEEDANQIINNIEFLKKSIKSGSQRYRKTNVDICEKAINSTNEMIDSIKKINEIDISKWIDNNQTSYSIEDSL